MDFAISQSPSKPPHRTKGVSVESQNIREMIEKLRSASNYNEMVVSCQSFSHYFNHELKVGKKRVSEQMAFLRSEKEKVLKQYAQKEEDVKRLKYQLDHMKTEYKLIDKQRVKTLQSQLQAAINEQASWKAKAKDLEDTCESLQLINTLQKKLSSESEVIRQYEQKLIDAHDDLKKEREKNQLVMAQRDDLTRKLLLERDQVKSLQRLVDKLKNRLDSEEQLLDDYV